MSSVSETYSEDLTNLSGFDAVSLRKAKRMRNSGIVLTTIGTSSAIAAIVSIIRIASDDPNSEQPDMGPWLANAMYPYVNLGTALFLSPGIPLWAVGNKRVKKIKLSQDKKYAFRINPYMNLKKDYHLGFYVSIYANN